MAKSLHPANDSVSCDLSEEDDEQSKGNYEANAEIWVNTFIFCIFNFFFCLRLFNKLSK